MDLQQNLWVIKYSSHSNLLFHTRFSHGNHLISMTAPREPKESAKKWVHTIWISLYILYSKAIGSWQWWQDPFPHSWLSSGSAVKCIPYCHSLGETLWGLNQKPKVGEFQTRAVFSFSFNNSEFKTHQNGRKKGIGLYIFNEAVWSSGAP